MAKGKEAKIAAAISRSQKNTSPKAYAVGIATTSGFIDSSWIKVKGYKNCIQDRVKANMLADMIPGEARGRTTCTNALIREQPSIMAHSSISLGMVLK